LRRALLSWLAVGFFLFLAAACASRRASRPLTPTDVRPGYSEEGLASWYGGADGLEGKPTASGEIFDGSKLTAAHRRLALGTVVSVTNLNNGKSVRVRINDRGPFVKGRIVDLSRAAAREVGLIATGTAPVRLTVVSPGPEPTPVPPGFLWAVQVGSFADRSRADRHAERVREAGHKVYFEAYRGLTRVKVGPFESREKAQAALSRIEAQGFEGILVPANAAQ
jgi:rare lipoprotein A